MCHVDSLLRAQPFDIEETGTSGFSVARAECSEIFGAWGRADRVRLVRYVFLFSDRVQIGMESGKWNIEAATKVDGCFMHRNLLCCPPKIKLISGGAADEAAKRIFGQIHGERATCRTIGSV